MTVTQPTVSRMILSGMPLAAGTATSIVGAVMNALSALLILLGFIQCGAVELKYGNAEGLIL